ncbi:MAG: hypothetical protein CL917_03870 [Deltaproteobacteria bacterium]|nr:hypothetical protein [Deltaproteobacteria bacterium]
MNNIQSLLWIGNGQGLAHAGITEAPSLDVTWIKSVEDVFALPPTALDGILLEGTNAPELIKELKELQRKPLCPPILVYLPQADSQSIRDLLRAGAHEILTPSVKDHGPSLLQELLDRLHRIHGTPSHQSSSTQNTLPQNQSLAMQTLESLITRAAHSTATVLIQGETGTGKEVTAKQIHTRGPRKKFPFVALNCAAFPETLLESELFGHKRGAFTGADRDKSGHFAEAHQGTLFLDEVAEMTPALQAKLLRVLQEKEVLAIGASRPQPIDVRIITATNENLQSRVEQGLFRQDLYYRLAVFPMDVPPLRERTMEILPLARHFMQTYGAIEKKSGCQISAAAERLLESYNWPGNVRELENEIQRALTLAEPGEVIGPGMLSPRVIGLLEAVRHASNTGETLREKLECIEAWLIRRALSHNGGRRAATARKLGITREGLYKKMKRLHVEH